jgi:hypothetical protein
MIEISEMSGVRGGRCLDQKIRRYLTLPAFNDSFEYIYLRRCSADVGSVRSNGSRMRFSRASAGSCEKKRNESGESVSTLAPV